MTEIIKRDGSRQPFDAASHSQGRRISALNDAHIKDDDFFAEYVANQSR